MSTQPPLLSRLMWFGGLWLAGVLTVMAIGLVLQATTPGGSTDYSLDSFKWAFATQYVLWAIGIVQTLRYRPGQEYRPHFDFVASAEVRRLWTALIYLNDDYEGGGTAFPHIGLEVRGHTGDVLLFGNAAPDGGPEPLSEHAGLPVTSGAKYLATRWIRERRWIP